MRVQRLKGMALTFKQTMTMTDLSVVGHKERGGAVILHEVLGKELHPGVVPIEHHPLARRLGLPDEVVLQQCGGVQVHHHVDETWDTACGQGLEGAGGGGPREFVSLRTVPVKKIGQLLIQWFLFVQFFTL